MGFVHIGPTPHPKNASGVAGLNGQEVVVETVEVEKIVEVPVEKIVVQRVEVPVEVERLVEVPVREVEVRHEKVDLAPLEKRQQELERKIIEADNRQGLKHAQLTDLLDAQGRALVGLKADSHLARKRKLEMLRKLKRERDAQAKLNKQLKLAIAASLILSIVSLIAGL